MAANSLTTLDGLFHEIYADRMERLIPEFALVQKDIPFRRAKKLGEQYRQPVNLGMEQGVTYSTQSSGDTFKLVEAVPGARKKAIVTGSEMVLRSTISYKAAFSGETQKEAFSNSTNDVVYSMKDSSSRRLEIELLYGQKELGVVSGTPAANVVTLTTASWAPGIWSGMEGAYLQVFDTGLTALRAGTNTDANYGTYYKVTAVDFDNRTITVDDDQNIANTDVIYFHSARNSTDFSTRSMAGLDTIITNTGTLFSISAASYSLWKGTTIDASSSPLEFDMFLAGASKVQAKGMVREFCAYVNPLGWQDLMSDLAALRRIPAVSRGGYELGAESIKFHTQNGTMVIKSHPCVKEGDAFCIPLKVYARIGSTDITFRRPAAGQIDRSNSFFRELTDDAGYELRNYSDQSLFTHRPGLSFKISNIVNTTS